jgi:excisionase family DNA binding protein
MSADDNAKPIRDPTSATGNVDRLLKVKEVADLLQVAEGTVYHFLSQGRLPAIRISKRCVRFSQREILLWLRGLNQ